MKELEPIRQIINAYNEALGDMAKLCKFYSENGEQTIPISVVLDQLQASYLKIKNVTDTATLVAAANLSNSEENNGIDNHN